MPCFWKYQRVNLRGGWEGLRYVDMLWLLCLAVSTAQVTPDDGPSDEVCEDGGQRPLTGWYPLGHAIFDQSWTGRVAVLAAGD